MQYVKIRNIPKIRFAHVYGATKYTNVLPKRKNSIEICYIAEGKTLQGRTGEIFTVEKYDVVCNLHSEEWNISALKFHQHHTVSFQLDFELAEQSEDALYLPDILSFQQPNAVHSLIDEIIRMHTLYPEKKLAISGLLLQLLSEIDLRARQVSLNGYHMENVYVFNAKEYIYKNVYRPITQKEIAAHLKITPEYLCALFKKSTGISLIRFINKVKLSGIQTAMERENLKLYEAAELYGYSDPNYVSRLFKKYYGYNITDCKKNT